jgi:methylated-DNA-protein-cysteine methyltransferase-like protein
MMSSFFEKVHRLVQQVPPGKVTSYGAIARMLEHPLAARTVGWAMHGIPEGSDVPWWRVLNSKGCISLAGEHGASLQRELLEAEGVEVSERGCVDLKRFGWEGLPWYEIEALMKEE